MASTTAAPASVRPLSLYALTEDLAALEAALLESGGEISPEMEVDYADLLEMHADKLEGYVAMIRQFEATEAAIKLERERLQAAERTMANAARALKDRLCFCMQRRGETECQTRLGKVKLQRAASVPVVLKVDVDELPPHFQRVKVEADLTGLRNALKEGDEVALRLAEFGEASVYVRLY